MNNYRFVMKKILLITLALGALVACTKWITSDSEDDTLSKEFKHTGCAAETRGLYGDDPSLLTLKYENGDLRVTRTNAELDCGFKERGLTCKAYIEGNVIHYDVVFEKEGFGVANCICPVEKMTSVVTGLEKGKEYTFHYRVLYWGYKPITFTFNKSLHEVYDVDTLYDIVIDE